MEMHRPHRLILQHPDGPRVPVRIAIPDPLPPRLKLTFARPRIEHRGVRIERCDPLAEPGRLELRRLARCDGLVPVPLRRRALLARPVALLDEPAPGRCPTSGQQPAAPRFDRSPRLSGRGRRRLLPGRGDPLTRFGRLRPVDGLVLRLAPTLTAAETVRLTDLAIEVILELTHAIRLASGAGRKPLADGCPPEPELPAALTDRDEQHLHVRGGFVPVNSRDSYSRVPAHAPAQSHQAGGEI